MDIQKILLQKMEELRPGAQSFSGGLGIETGSMAHNKSKMTIKVHLMAFYDKAVDGDKTYFSEWYEKNTVAECIAEIDMKIHNYKKTEKLELS